MRTKTQVYVYTDDDGNERWLDVDTMRRWAESNLELTRIAIDSSRVEELISSGDLDKEQIRKNIETGHPKPVLICLDLVKEGYQIVDGNHSYVTSALAAGLAKQMGIHKEQHSGVDGWALTPDQWRPFLISRQIQSTQQNAQT
ncbi:hypothetical protein [Aliiroseovarius sp. F20344]|uniref:hypothetical protein n=1 Tax=Aliiroseovarius sp. F20344 TaxID=2926414 RepID=UPI001FF5D062|nr:hypothetical protein [Aliiroseovarius sp. F20344]MCK0142997.1 hypothetical protein [Aliiroseovarius sp. F20344]